MKTSGVLCSSQESRAHSPSVTAQNCPGSRPCMLQALHPQGYPNSFYTLTHQPPLACAQSVITASSATVDQWWPRQPGKLPAIPGAASTPSPMRSEPQPRGGGRSPIPSLSFLGTLLSSAFFTSLWLLSYLSLIIPYFKLAVTERLSGLFPGSVQTGAVVDCILNSYSHVLLSHHKPLTLSV